MVGWLCKQSPYHFVYPNHREVKMDFEEALNALREMAAEGADTTIYDDLSASYNGVNERASSADAKIAEMEAANATLLSQVSDLKAKNYDLLMQVQSDTKTEDLEDDTLNADDPHEGPLDDAFTYDSEDED